MKKKVYRLSGVDCANCGLKIENKLSKLDGMYSCSFVFLTQRLNVLFDEKKLSDDIIDNVVLNTISGVRITSKIDLEVTDSDLKLCEKDNIKIKRFLFGKKI